MLATSTCRIFVSSLFDVFYGYTIHHTTKVSEEVNRKLPARNTTVQLLTLCTDPERAAMHSVTDGQTNGQTDDIMMPKAIILCNVSRSSMIIGVANLDG